MWEGQALMPVSQGFCRSELAREKLIGAAFIQEARVIVEVFREQARSYRGQYSHTQNAQRPPEGGLCVVKRQLSARLT